MDVPEHMFYASPVLCLEQSCSTCMQAGLVSLSSHALEEPRGGLGRAPRPDRLSSRA